MLYHKLDTVGGFLSLEQSIHVSTIHKQKMYFCRAEVADFVLNMTS